MNQVNKSLPSQVKKRARKKTELEKLLADIDKANEREIAASEKRNQLRDEVSEQYDSDCFLDATYAKEFDLPFEAEIDEISDLDEQGERYQFITTKKTFLL